jgi:ABC-type uncharacterized transport system involved in gliding motility auxiliary subunit
MLDAPLKLGTTDIADNDALTSLLQNWGVTVDKDLVLDPAGQVLGLGPQFVLVENYGSQPIVDEMKRTRTPTGFPLARSIEIKNSDKTNIEKLFDSSGNAFATPDLSSSRVSGQDPRNKRGPLTIGAAGTYNTGKEKSQGRFVVIGSSGWLDNGLIGQLGNSDLALNAVNWLSSDEDMISIRPKPPEDRRITLTRSQLSLVRATSQFVLPLIVVVAGFGVWWKRR